MLSQLDLSGGTCLIKPNFFNHCEGYYTDAQTLDIFLGAIPTERIVVECYTAARTDGSRAIEPGQGREHLDWLREQDRRFFADSGIGEILAKHDAEFLNVTEEIWGGRNADAREVARLVERRCPPVVHTELYGCIPQRLFDLRGAPMLNLAKLKVRGPGTDTLFFSLGMKNLFGLIPEPDRSDYHGKDRDGLASSIADMCKIYAALFDVTHVVEAVHNTLIARDTFIDPDNPRKGVGLVRDLGLAITGRDPVEIDALVVSQFGCDPAERHFLKAGRGILGDWDAACFPQIPPVFASFFAGYRQSGVEGVHTAPGVPQETTRPERRSGEA